MVVCVVLGFAAVRRRDLVQHGAWMTRGYALGLGAGTQALLHLPWLLVVSGKPGVFARALLMGAGWVINLAVAEWIIRRRPVHPARSQLPSREPSGGILERRRAHAKLSTKRSRKLAWVHVTHALGDLGNVELTLEQVASRLFHSHLAKIGKDGSSEQRPKSTFQQGLVESRHASQFSKRRRRGQMLDETPANAFEAIDVADRNMTLSRSCRFDELVGHQGNELETLGLVPQQTRRPSNVGVQDLVEQAKEPWGYGLREERIGIPALGDVTERFGQRRQPQKLAQAPGAHRNTHALHRRVARRTNTQLDGAFGLAQLERVTSTVKAMTVLRARLEYGTLRHDELELGGWLIGAECERWLELASRHAEADPRLQFDGAHSAPRIADAEGHSLLGRADRVDHERRNLRFGRELLQVVVALPRSTTARFGSRGARFVELSKVFDRHASPKIVRDFRLSRHW
jgi:hypothetical protein